MTFLIRVDSDTVGSGLLIVNDKICQDLEDLLNELIFFSLPVHVTKSWVKYPKYKTNGFQSNRGQEVIAMGFRFQHCI